MVDIQKQVKYWRQGAEEDWTVAQELTERGKIRHALFLAHLALEKTLKAHVCRVTDDLAPRTHNLVKLAEMALLELAETDLDLLAEVNEFNLKGATLKCSFRLRLRMKPMSTSAG